MNTIHNLTNAELSESLLRLVMSERETTLEILRHLNEIERRKLFLELGYSSLFNYAVRKLRYSESAAWRRIATARCIKDYQEVAALLEAGDVNLSTITLVAKVLNPENVNMVLRAIKGKTQGEVKLYVSTLRPAVAIREHIKPVAVQKNSPIKVEIVEALPLFTSAAEVKNESKSELASQTEQQTEQRFEIRFHASADFMKAYRRIEKLLSGKFPRGMRAEELFQQAMEFYLQHKSPEQREERRMVRSARKATVPGGVKSSGSIPQKLRDRILVRDGHKCTFVGVGGELCGSTWDLEVDHVLPRAWGGGHEEQNLRTLCRRHNMHYGRMCFGERRMNFICDGREQAG